MVVFRAVFALILSAFFALPALAQVPLPSGGAEAQPVIVPEDLTPELVDDMVARMSDDQVRSLLLDRLDAVAAENAAAAGEDKGLLVAIGDGASAMLVSWTEVLQKAPALFSKQGEAFTNFSEKFGSAGLMHLFGFAALAVLAGLAAEWVFGLWTRRWIKVSPAGADQDLRGAVSFLARRFLRELFGLIVFYYTLVFVGRRLLDAGDVAYVAPLVFYLIWMPRLGAAISRFALAPHRSDLRLVHVNDDWARYLHRNLIGLFLLIGFTMFIIRFNALNGVPMAGTRLGFWLNTSIHVYIGLIAWTARDGLSEMMRGSDPDRTTFDERVADYYPYLAIGVSFVMWLVVEYLVATKNPELIARAASGAHFVTMFWLLMAPAFDTMIRGLVRHLQPPMIGDGPIAEEAYRSSKRSFIRIGRVIAGMVVIVMIGRAWDLNLHEVVGTSLEAGGRIVQFFLIVAIGYILNEIISLWINQRLAKEQTAAVQSMDVDAGEGGGAGGSRLSTVLPLLRVSGQVAIAVIFTLLALGALGINITPLLAGAGVMGLAIGFGAQKLVADIVGGVFFLIDDAFRIGEYVDVGGTTGTVEKISIRSMQLRHHRGPVHTIPYGEIQKLTNYSRDWVIMKLKFTVPFDTDPHQVKKIFKRIGAEMMEDELFKDGFLEPFKSQGVFDFDDVGMIIRGKFMAKPGQQFTLRKEIYNRVKKSFGEAGIDFARREVRIAIPGIGDADQLMDELKNAT